jgi:hypothetical protein
MLAQCESLPRSKIAGAPADWTHRGDFEGYSVLPGCAHGKDVVPLAEAFEEPEVIVAGKGKGWFGGVEPCPPELGECRYTSAEISRGSYQRRRATALSTIEDLPTPRVESYSGTSASTACTSRGMYLEVSIQDWHDMDRAARFIGEHFHVGDLQERVGIHLEAFKCAVPE